MNAIWLNNKFDLFIIDSNDYYYNNVLLLK